jgi:hypothetical protein
MQLPKSHISLCDLDVRILLPYNIHIVAISGEMKVPRYKQSTDLVAWYSLSYSSRDVKEFDVNASSTLSSVALQKSISFRTVTF